MWGRGPLSWLVCLCPPVSLCPLAAKGTPAPHFASPSGEKVGDQSQGFLSLVVQVLGNEFSLWEGPCDKEQNALLTAWDGGTPPPVVSPGTQSLPGGRPGVSRQGPGCALGTPLADLPFLAFSQYLGQLTSIPGYLNPSSRTEILHFIDNAKVTPSSRP